MTHVRVRIAPSPTGDPHVGTAYIALFNYVFAKKQGGSFILRIEDTDQQRTKPGSEEMIYSSLKWLGLSWNEGPDCGGSFGPYRQSERLEIYRDHVLSLVKTQKAYPCFCTPERLQQMREEQKARAEQTGYDGLCRSLGADESHRRILAGESHVFRLRCPDQGKLKFYDKLRGEIEIDLTQIDDQVLLKADGFPTYHLANVVDDHLMQVTHVIRAEEWISSTPKHELLYDAFGWTKPEWIHMPLLRNTDKSKISKRKNPVSLNYYRRMGYLPQGFLNFLALMGWNPGEDREVFTLNEMIELFDWERVHLGSPVFDHAKLDWLNQKYMAKLSAKDFSSLVLSDLCSESYLEKIFPLISERLDKLSDFFSKNTFLFAGDLELKLEDWLDKNMDGKAFAKILEALSLDLDELYVWTAASLEKTIQGFMESQQLKPKTLLMPLRMICFGRKDSPPLFETMEVLGREMVRARISRAISDLKLAKRG